MAKWMMYSKKADFQEIAARHGVDQVIARILVNRGVTEETQIRQYLHPSADDLMDGSRMRDMEKAVTEIRQTVDRKEKITVFLNNQSADAEIPPMNGKILWQQGYVEKNNSLAPMGFAVFTQEV